MTDDSCGYTTAEGTPCQHFATEDDGRCWQHSDDPDAETGGRPRAFDDEQTRQRVLVAAGQGLKVEHQASLAGVSPDTLRRALCCVKTPRDPVLDDDPCEFCANYARAHANGAREVLQECRPEFVASASYGYVKEEKRDLTSSDGSFDLSIQFSDDGDD